ncbi:MAG: sodium ion-translocating decarboxylase subunit beta [Ruminococcaceae bacterium]|nr:sodium ion-translocating decarboxylase subunit beta [Oscillospiraceae bacterium]
MNLYEQYIKNKFDLSAFGIERGESRSDYFCTPKGAKIIGWTGVDGIHYCTIKALGEIVFAVEPMGDAGRHAFPVAKDFEDFLRLLMACGHEAYIEQAHAWSREHYEAFAKDNPISEEARALIDQLAEQFGLAPTDDPYNYLKDIYDSFDFSAVPYKKDYYEYVPKDDMPLPKEWNVYFSLDGKTGREKAGEEVALNKSFLWDGHSLSVPSFYVCSRGLVIDLFVEIDSEKAQAYLFRETFSEDSEDISEDAENPFTFDFRASVTVNGIELKQTRAKGNRWALGFEFYESESMRDILNHYELSLEKCYVWRRICFPWATKSKPNIKNFSLKLEQRPKSMLVNKFFVKGSGEQIKFEHPVTKSEHTLTVTEYLDDKLSGFHPVSDGYEHPAYCTKMAYTLEPDLTNTEFSVSDTRHSDPPKKTNIPAKEYDFVSSIAIIGGADGPTAVFLGVPQNSQNLHAACSALTFEPQNKVEWKITIRAKTVDDIETELI